MKSKTFNISLPEELVKEVDLLARKEYRNRSELIKEALRSYLSDHKDWSALFRYGEGKAEELGIDSEEQIFEICS